MLLLCRSTRAASRRVAAVPVAAPTIRRVVAVPLPVSSAPPPPMRWQQQQRRAVATSWTVDAHTGVVVEQRGTGGGDDDQPAARYQVVVGLEIHAQLNIATKLFSPARNSSSTTTANSAAPSAPNTAVHPFDVAVPGVLPVLSAAAVRAAVLTAAALRCRVRDESRFERKHYAYADLPHGYQITQQRWPLATGGLIACHLGDGDGDDGAAAPSHRRHRGNRPQQPQQLIECRVNRIQLEQDTAKTIVSSPVVVPVMGSDDDDDETAGRHVSSSRVDFNRAGVALTEIVTEPDLRSSAAAGAVVRAVQHLLRHAGTCRGRMEAGQLRVDCNVNLVVAAVPHDLGGGGAPLDPHAVATARVEVKNLNSIQQVQDCIKYEAQRQADILWQQQQNVRLSMHAETRTWNAVAGRTEVLRRKDGDTDYRFLPEPDLPPVLLTPQILNGCATVDEFVARYLPELPAAAVARLTSPSSSASSSYGLSHYQARVIVASGAAAVAYFDAAMRATPEHERRASATVTANLLCNELFALVKEHHVVVDGHIVDNDDDDNSNGSGGDHGTAALFSTERCAVSAAQLASVVQLLRREQISSTMAKKLLAVLFTTEYAAAGIADPHAVATDRGWTLITAAADLHRIVSAVLENDDDTDMVAVYRRGGRHVSNMQKLLTGRAMAASGGNAHPERLRDVVADCLRTAAAAAAAVDGGPKTEN